MPEQLNLPFEWIPDGNEGVKPREQSQVAEYDTANSYENLANKHMIEDEVSLLESILDEENIQEACKRVQENKGAPGPDGITTSRLEAFMKGNWSTIAQAIRTGSYRPSPVRRVEIPKPTGGIRLLGIPNVIDRVIQQAILQVLTPIFDPKFSEHSYGFRPGRSAHAAVRQAKKYVEEGYPVVVDIDIEKFFDRVNHDILMSRVARTIKDKAVLKLIRRYLQAGVLLNGVRVCDDMGVPQGGPLSPLLANILLDDLDRELENRKLRFCRYADDCNVYVGSWKAGNRVKESVTRFLEEKLKLKVNEEKSAVDLTSRRKFLGFSLLVTGVGIKICISSQSIKRLKDQIRFFTRRRWSISMEERIEKLNRYLTGWLGYYALSDEPSILDNITAWMRRRLRACYWRQWKKSSTRYRKLVSLKVTAETAYMTAYSSRGIWKASIFPAVQSALNNDFWAKLGLINLCAKHMNIRQGWRTAVYGPVCTVV